MKSMEELEVMRAHYESRSHGRTARIWWVTREDALPVAVVGLSTQHPNAYWCPAIGATATVGRCLFETEHEALDKTLENLHRKRADIQDLIHRAHRRQVEVGPRPPAISYPRQMPGGQVQIKCPWGSRDTYTGYPIAEKWGSFRFLSLPSSVVAYLDGVAVTECITVDGAISSLERRGYSKETTEIPEE